MTGKHITWNASYLRDFTYEDERSRVSVQAKRTGSCKPEESSASQTGECRLPDMVPAEITRFWSIWASRGGRRHPLCEAQLSHGGCTKKLWTPTPRSHV